VTTKEEMNTNKRIARIVGGLILTATATYMLGSGLLESILNAPDYLLQVYPNSTQVVIGVLLEFVDAAAVVGIGIMLFPILRKHNEAIALGYAGTRQDSEHHRHRGQPRNRVRGRRDRGSGSRGQRLQGPLRGFEGQSVRPLRWLREILEAG
jgi:hypothetical protein